MRISADSWIINKPIAHRGLWGEDVPENSMTAYILACERKMPIEIDLYLTKDNYLVSFHDNDLERMTGVKGKIWDFTLAELKTFTLNGSTETIPTFEEILFQVEGKSPLLIEIKQQPLPNIVEKVVERLKMYKGEFAVQSFDPTYMLKVKKLAPEFIRGILATNCFEDGLPAYKKYVVKNMVFNPLLRPDFVSYDKCGYPLPKSKTKNKVKLCWTVTNQEEYDKVKPYVDNVIYEGFELNK